MKKTSLLVILFLLLALIVGIAGATGNISVSSVPSGATILLNGTSTGLTTPATVENVPAGSHTILLQKSGYQDATQTSVAVTDDSTSTVSLTLTATTAAPTLSGITPSSGYNTSPVSITGLTGTGFTTSTYPTVVLRRSGSTNITATSVTGTATALTCSFDITGKPAGAWDVILTNPDGLSATLTNGFTINSNTAAATLTSITPTSGVTNTTVSITALSGTGFVGTPQVYLKRSNYNNIYSTVSTASSTTIVGTINLNNQAPGSYQVCIVNSGSDPVCGLSFTINTPATANGSISFTSSPSSAVVLVDSVKQGNTPFTLYNVTPGSYIIKMQRASYLEWSERITVTAGNQTTVAGKLTPVDTSTTVTTAPPVVVTTATLPPTTVKSTKTVPTPWKDTATTAASPVEFTVIIGALAATALVLRRK